MQTAAGKFVWPKVCARSGGPSRTAVWQAARERVDLIPLSSVAPRPSIGRRMFRAVTRFCIAVLIGVGATLGWQAYGDTAREMLAAQRSGAGLAAARFRDEAGRRYCSANPALQLEPLASKLEIVRRSVEQLAAQAGTDGQKHRRAAGHRRGYQAEGVVAAAPPRPSPRLAVPQPKPAPAKAAASRAAVIVGASPVACARPALARAALSYEMKRSLPTRARHWLKRLAQSATGSGWQIAHSKVAMRQP